MIPPAPVEFWEKVIARVAVLVMEREANTGGASQRGQTPATLTSVSGHGTVDATTLVRNPTGGSAA